MVTVSDMKKQLLMGRIADIDGILPAGVDMKLAILAGLNLCSDTELDDVGKMFGIIRVTNYWLPESNTVFSSRITDFVAQEVMGFRARRNGVVFGSMPSDSYIPNPDWDSMAGCNHRWKKYVGIMDSFEFCEHCDEKRR